MVDLEEAVATRRHFWIVAAGDAARRLPLADAADVKEKSDLGATAQPAQLVVRGK